MDDKDNVEVPSGFPFPFFPRAYLTHIWLGVDSKVASLIFFDQFDWRDLKTIVAVLDLSRIHNLPTVFSSQTFLVSFTFFIVQSIVKFPLNSVTCSLQRRILLRQKQSVLCASLVCNSHLTVHYTNHLTNLHFFICILIQSQLIREGFKNDMNKKYVISIHLGDENFTEGENPKYGNSIYISLFYLRPP